MKSMIQNGAVGVLAWCVLLLPACRLACDPDDPWLETDCDNDGAEGIYLKDCDDRNAEVQPGVAERCNGIDDDCNGIVDEDPVDATQGYADADGDAYGDPDQPVQACGALPEGAVADGTDCDDTNGAISPGQAEVCDNADQNCDGLQDEGLPTESWYRDADGDGYGTDDDVLEVCDSGERPEGYVDNSDDCHDDDRDLVCDRVDLGTGDADWSINGAEPNGQAGAALVPVGDLDGDGIADLVVGVPGEDIVFLAAGGLLKGQRDVELSEALPGWRGPDAAYFGKALVSGIDVDGDGRQDVLVGVPRLDEGGRNAGGAFLYLGGSEQALSGTSVPELGSDYRAASAFIGLSADAQVGASVAVGNAGGTGDFVVALGAPDAEPIGVESGEVWVTRLDETAGRRFVDSADFIRLLGRGAEQRVGESLVLADVDGDGAADLVVGAPGGAGGVYIVKDVAGLGSGDTYIMDDEGSFFAGAQSDSLVGGSVAVVDFDGDGAGDVVVGAGAVSVSEGGHEGAVYLLPSTMVRDATLGGAYALSEVPPLVTGNVTAQQLGMSVANAGRIQGGDAEDLLVTNVNCEGWLFIGRSGSPGTLDPAAASASYTGEAGTRCSLAAAGDVDGDGIDEVALGNAEAAYSVGAVDIYLHGGI